MGSSDDHAVVMGDWLPRDEFGNYVDRNCSISKNDASNAKSQLNKGGGLAERMAARAGFRAPSRLNTEALRSPGLYSKPDARFRFLTVPPGPSPTTLLESPVFLSNSMVQPSPTTGKFHFATSINNQDSTLMLHDGDTGKKNTCEDPNGSSFAFKSSTELAPFTHVDEANNCLRKADVALHPEQPGQRSTGPLISQVDSSSFLFHAPSFSHPDQNHCPVPVPKNRRSSEDLAAGYSSAEDGYSWRKYGQKHVKGSEYPRSYYKCTNQNCPVKKKVERSNEGHITEIIYKGAHNHPKPDNLEPMSSLQLGREYSNGLVDGVEELSALSNNDEDDRVMHGSAALDESESKRRRMESYGGEVCGASRGIREPRVVVQTRSDVDVLDDGYRWRKYGQKVVKGNPNPRSYYKCTSPGCNVRKHVERASHDLKSVITTYEGKHHHDVPTARNSGNLNSEGPNTQHAPVRGMSSLGLLAQPQPGPGLWMTRPSPPPLLQLEPMMGSGSNSARGSSPYLQQLMGNVNFLKTFSW